MLKELLEDCKYIAKVASQDFQPMVAIKFTIIPFIAGLFTYAASSLPFLLVPKWAWIPVTIFTIVLRLLFVMARQMRELETPNIDVRFTQESLVTAEMQTGKLDGPRPHHLFLVIKNTSHRRVNDLKVKLMRIQLDSSGFQEPRKSLTFLNHNNNNNEISINSNDEEWAFLGNYAHHEGRGIYELWDMKRIDSPSLAFVVQISSGSFPAFTKKFVLTQNTNWISLREAKDE